METAYTGLNLSYNLSYEATSRDGVESVKVVNSLEKQKKSLGSQRDLNPCLSLERDR